jgi:hypothetical protein
MIPKKKIFDCFIFYNEIEILKLRLHELYNSIDYFVICESTVTFRGKPKPLFFREQRHQFGQFMDKIIHIVVEDMPAVSTEAGSTVVGDHDQTVWGREHYQRNAIKRGLDRASLEDIVIISDCDEIIRPDTIDILRANSGYFLLDMPMYQFFYNMCAQDSGWKKPFAYSYYLDDKIPDYNFNRTHEITSGMPDGTSPSLEERNRSSQNWPPTLTQMAGSAVCGMRTFCRTKCWL